MRAKQAVTVRLQPYFMYCKWQGSEKSTLLAIVWGVLIYQAVLLDFQSWTL